MIGLNRDTGQAISGLDHIYQSIRTILTTPIGTRVMRRPVGSDLMKRVDAPNNAATRVLLFADVATALMRWEPRIKVLRISLANEGPGNASSLVIDIEGIYAETGEPISTSVTIAGNA